MQMSLLSIQDLIHSCHNNNYNYPMVLAGMGTKRAISLLIISRCEKSRRATDVELTLDDLCFLTEVQQPGCPGQGRVQVPPIQIFEIEKMTC